VEGHAFAQLELPNVIGNRPPFDSKAWAKLLVAVLVQHPVVDQADDLVVVAGVVIVRIHGRDL
jgi:hypothetical protein